MEAVTSVGKTFLIANFVLFLIANFILFIIANFILLLIANFILLLIAKYILFLIANFILFQPYELLRKQSTCKVPIHVLRKYVMNIYPACG